MTLEWLSAALLGLTFTCASARCVFYPAQVLRSFLWMLLLSFGAQIRASLRFFSVLVGVLVALPLFSAIGPSALNPLESHSTTHFISLVLFIPVGRFFLRPGTSLNWPLIRAWEQEVISKPAIPILQAIHTLFSKQQAFDRPDLRRRIWTLSKELSKTEFLRSTQVDEILLRGTGILILHVSALLVPTHLNQFRPEIALWFASLSLYASLRILLKKSSISINPYTLFVTHLPVIALFLFRRLSPSPYLFWLPKTQLIAKYEIIMITLAMLLTCIAFLRLSRKSWSAEAPTLTAIVGIRRYAILRKVTELGKSLTKSRNLIPFLVLIDLFVATLRISLAWL